MNKNATRPRKGNEDHITTQTGGIPDSVGFGGSKTGGGVVRKLTAKEKAQQKRNIKGGR